MYKYSKHITPNNHWLIKLVMSDWVSIAIVIIALAISYGLIGCIEFMK